MEIKKNEIENCVGKKIISTTISYLENNEVNVTFSFNAKLEDVKSLIIGEDDNDVSRIKTFADACIECGTIEEEFNDKFLNLNLSTDVIAYEKLKIIVKALNKEWVPNWEDSNEYKYFAYFNGFSGIHCAYSTIGSVSSSKLGPYICFKTKELAKYAQKQFEDIYKDFFTNKA